MADYDSSLPVRTENDGDVVSKLAGLTTANIAEVNASNEQLVKDTDVNTTQTDGTQKTQVVDGAGDVLAVNTDGSINVNVVAAALSATEKQVYGTVAAGVPNTPNNVVDYTVTALKTFILRQFQASGSGKLKVEVKVGPAASEVTKATFFNSTADPNVGVTFASPIEVPAGEKILVVVTNKDQANQDLYAFINGNEV